MASRSTASSKSFQELPRRWLSLQAAGLLLSAKFWQAGSTASRTSGLAAAELRRLAEEALPALHSQRPNFVVRELSDLGERVSVLHWTASGQEQPFSFAVQKEKSDPCILLDVFEARPSSEIGGKAVPLHLDVDALRLPPYEICLFRVLWARGRGGLLDWMPDEPEMCDIYDALLVEDEFLLNKWQANPPACPVHPLCPHEVPFVEMSALPWRPRGKLPVIDKALVSFHAYLAHSPEGETNPQRWLQDPDLWNPHFIELHRKGYLKVCMTEKDCENDKSPFRLMFWEDISSEFVDCLNEGVTPVYFFTPAIYEYVSRDVLLVRYTFESILEMQELVQLLSSPEGILEHGTQVYMQRQSNHILGTLYWRQNVHLRALLTASAAYQQRFLLAPTPESSSSGSDGVEGNFTAVVAELVACVMSSVDNRRHRDIVRTTWGRDKHVRTTAGWIHLRVLFFLADAAGAREEQEDLGDVVILQGLEESFSSIWLKTAAIIKFGADYFQGRIPGHDRDGEPALRFLLKCDDDTFIDIEALASDVLASPPVGLYWGHVMALVEPNRIDGDKYFVPREVYPMEYYPPYARGMAYVLSEDLVCPLGTALAEGHVDPFPYREDVSVGLYLLSLARRGQVRVVPRQRKDAMPLDFPEHCSTGGRGRLLVLHRFRQEDASCLWRLLEARRAISAPAPQSVIPPVDFCQCLLAQR